MHVVCTCWNHFESLKLGTHDETLCWMRGGLGANTTRSLYLNVHTCWSKPIWVPCGTSRSSIVAPCCTSCLARSWSTWMRYGWGGDGMMLLFVVVHSDPNSTIFPVYVGLFCNGTRECTNVNSSMSKLCTNTKKNTRCENCSYYLQTPKYLFYSSTSEQPSSQHKLYTGIAVYNSDCLRPKRTPNAKIN